VSQPVITPEIADRLDRSEAEYMASDMLALRNGDDNPLGVEVRSFGGATALTMTGLADWEFNRVLGLRDQSPAEIGSLLVWYRERRVDCHFDVVPMLCSTRVLGSLAERGFYQSGFHTALYGGPGVESHRPAEGVEVTEVGAGDMAVFAELYMGYMDDLNIARGPRQRARANVESQHPLPGWRLYVATVDGTPAAFAALFVSDGVGSLAGAATVPELRRRGCQTALLHRRTADAVADGCDLIASQATPGSVSQRNMERAGLRVAYTKAVWSRR
jgi:hypothetical protein